MKLFAIYKDMKSYFMALVACAGLFLCNCRESLLDPRYTLRLPEPPPAWDALLGSPYWQIEWLNSKGRIETVTVQSGENVEISLLPDRASAVSAAPFWPDKAIRPGIFRPAGAIFPFDVSGKSLILSWQGGVDANLFWELVTAYDETGLEPIPETDEITGQVRFINDRAAIPRLPWNFDWPRFRQLFDDSTVNAEVRADPWLADWSGIAAKIVESGFDKRRMVPEPRNSLTIPADAGMSRGPWAGISPFAPPLLFETDLAFPVRPTIDTWVSGEGMIRCNTETWIFIPQW